MPLAKKKRHTLSVRKAEATGGVKSYADKVFVVTHKRRGSSASGALTFRTRYRPHKQPKVVSTWKDLAIGRVFNMEQLSSASELSTPLESHGGELNSESPPMNTQRIPG